MVKQVSWCFEPSEPQKITTHILSTILERKPRKTITYVLEPTYIPRELNTGTTYDQTEMQTEVKELYERLYAHRDCKGTALTPLVLDIPTLSGQDSELIEG